MGYRARLTQIQDKHHVVGFSPLTKAAVQLRVRAGGAVLGSQVDLGVEVLGHGGVALLTGGFLRVQRHFGTFNDDVMDFIPFPSAGKQTPSGLPTPQTGDAGTAFFCLIDTQRSYLVGSSSWSLVPVTSSG